MRTPTIAALALVVGAPSPAAADTVYLRNGNWIHGVVRWKTDDLIRIEIGELGHLEIPADQIYEIEENDRTGSGYALSDEWTDDIGGSARLPAPSALKEIRPAEPVEPATGDEPGRDGEEPRDAATRDEPPIDPQLRERIEKHVYDLQRQKSRHRVRAERHLKSIGEPALPFLLPLVSHTHDIVRIAVFRIFHAIGDESVIDACIEALADENLWVRDYAERTLRRLTNRYLGAVRNADRATCERVRQRWREWWTEEQARGEAPRRESATGG